MVWNKDLAKLKQELKSEEVATPKRPAPKPTPKPEAPRELEEEDALFLAAMGKRKPSATPLEEKAVTTVAPPVAKPAPAKEEFKEAMASLKGEKPVPASRVPVAESKPIPPARGPEPVVEPAAEPPILEVPPPSPILEGTPPVRTSPLMIQLAAGMAIEVDGALDLRGHSAADAVERLKERILDGHLLGWRTLHVQLGPSEELRQTFQDFLGGPEAELISRYAQAPIPMGGAQAWILYLGIQGSTTH